MIPIAHPEHSSGELKKHLNHNYILCKNKKNIFCFNPCHAEYIKMPYPLLIFSQSGNLIQIVGINSYTERQTVQIQISWLLKKPSDLDPHCLQKHGLSRFSRTRININLVCLFVLRFYGPVNPMGSCRARSVYLTTRLLGRLCPLSG